MIDGTGYQMFVSGLFAAQMPATVKHWAAGAGGPLRFLILKASPVFSGLISM
jgi:hypothetical protein